jgi:hypothetical protein
MKRSTTRFARPALEALEDRDVPSYLAAEFPGRGVWGHDSVTGTWTQLTAAEASQVAADSNGDVVGEFPGQGVGLYSAGAWWQITANNASVLSIGFRTGATDLGGSHTYWQISVAAEFPGQGLWAYYCHNVPGTVVAQWQQLTENNASLVAVNGNGHAVAEFPGQGVWIDDAVGWSWLTPSDATCLATGCAPDPRNPPNAYPFWPAAVVASFPGYGVFRIWENMIGQVGGWPWEQLTANTATALSVNRYGDVVGKFPGQGLWSYTASSAAAAAGWAAGWKQLTAADAVLVGIDAAGNVYGQFNGWGVWNDQVYSWQRLTADNATALGVGG